MKLRHQFTDITLLEQALTHSTWTNEHPTDPHNQRLELLGDAVLKLIVTDMLLLGHPDAAEGVLSERRAAIVGTLSLAAVAAALEIGPEIRFGGSEIHVGAQKPKILEDALEAVIAAIYLDGGLEAARAELVPLLQAAVVEPAQRPPKSELQEMLQKRGSGLPSYERVSVSGPDHERWFKVAVRVSGRSIAEGEGKTLKVAESVAARRALELLREAASAPSGGAA